ncbi:MAG: hypothetical protein HY548_00895 [Elusimicrobia bacterium]|nr:hypothetical protein [Elusimicrobiota bacterium]
MTRVRQLHKKLPYELSLALPGVAQQGTVAFAGPPSAKPVRVELYTAPDVEVSPKEFQLSSEYPSAAFTMKWIPNGNSPARGNRSFVAARAGRPAHPTERCQIYIMYFNGKRTAKTAQAPERNQ